MACESAAAEPSATAAHVTRCSIVNGAGFGTGDTGSSATEASLRMPSTMTPAEKREKGMPSPKTMPILLSSELESASTASGRTTSAGT